MGYRDWDQLGERLRDTVDEAVSSGNFTDLSRSIGDLVNDTIDSVKDSIQESADSVKNRARGSAFRTDIGGTVERDRRQTHAEYQPYRSAGTRQGRSTQGTAPVPYTKKAPGKAAGLFLTVFGLFMAVLFFLLLVAFLIAHSLSGLLLGAVAVFGVLTAAFAVMAGVGLKKLFLAGRYKKYIRKIGQHVYVSIQELAETVGKKKEFVMRELAKLIDKQAFYEAHLDKQDGYLILTDEAYETYVEAKLNLQSREEAAEKRRREEEELPQEIQKILNEGEEYIACIRVSNERIPDPVVTYRLNRMENLLIRIFEAVKQHPEVAGDLGKLMSYYLPTTRKLLDAYIELDLQPAAGENITSTKKEIEEALETLNNAFEKLLDGLFRDKAWDISSDISALNTILAQDGLKEDGFKL